MKKLSDLDQQVEKSRFLQKSEALINAGASGASGQLQAILTHGTEESKRSDKENKATPPYDPNQAASSAPERARAPQAPLQAKKKALAGLEIQIPQSPAPTDDQEMDSGQAPGRKQVGALGKNSTSQRDDTKSQRTQQHATNQVIRVTSSGSLAGNMIAKKMQQASTSMMPPQTTAAMRLNRQHQSPLLEQMQAS